MIKECKFCGRKFPGNAKQKYCPGGKCKKNYENSLRSFPELKGQQEPLLDPSETIMRPTRLNAAAAAVWDRLYPEVISIGILNIQTEDMFAELCDLHSRLIDINRELDKARIPAPESQDLSSVKSSGGLYETSEGGVVKESALSDLKRKYSKQILDYWKEFRLTPKSNPGNVKNGKQEDKDSAFD